MQVLRKNFTFVDLFSGIGGFHLAMKKFSDSCVCVWSSEIDTNCEKVYNLNFKTRQLGDIKKIDVIKDKLPCPDVICGGFPCQTFSKGGKQEGFNDSRGTLFREIIRIINDFKEKPKILILENVQNLVSHDKGNTRKVIYNELSSCGYNIIKKPIIASPKDFGIPQLRNRAIILGVRKDIFSGEISLSIERKKAGQLYLKGILIDNENKKELLLNKHQLNVLRFYDDLIKIFDKEDRVIGFPIWIETFNNSYDTSNFPKRKKDFVIKNQTLYKKYNKDIDKLIKKYNVNEEFTHTEKKFEWQAGRRINSVFDGIIQFRTSGIRVKSPTESPALVAMDHRTIYGPEKRYISVKEGALLQSFPLDFKFLDNDKITFKQLGNAVNVDVIYNVFKKFIEYLNKEISNDKRKV